MAWNGTKTFTNEPLIATDMNTYISNNLDALKVPPSGQTVLNAGADVTTTSTSWENIGGVTPTFTQTITTAGASSKVLVGFHANIRNATGIVYLDFTVDGVAHAGDDGIIGSTGNVTVPGVIFPFVRQVTGLTAGAHVFIMRWKVSAGTATLYAGAGTGSADLHPQFWVSEIS